MFGLYHDRFSASEFTVMFADVKAQETEKVWSVRIFEIPRKWLVSNGKVIHEMQ